MPEGTNQDTTEGIARDLSVPSGRNRRELAEQAPLDPNGLPGSWFIRIQDDEMDSWGIVLGEPQPGFFLVEITEGSVLAGREQTVRYQQLFTVEKMTKENWRFYDTAEDLHVGFADFVIGDRNTNP